MTVWQTDHRRKTSVPNPMPTGTMVSFDQIVCSITKQRLVCMNLTLALAVPVLNTGTVSTVLAILHAYSVKSTCVDVGLVHNLLLVICSEFWYMMSGTLIFKNFLFVSLKWVDQVKDNERIILINADWEETYCFIHFKDKCVCLSRSSSFAVRKNIMLSIASRQFMLILIRIIHLNEIRMKK